MRIFWFGLAGIILLMIVAGVFYYAVVPGRQVSTSTGDWGNYSIYIGTVISFCSLIVIFFLTTQVNRYNRENDRPIISFLAFDGTSYFLHNVGKGAAINIRVKANFVDQRWQHAFNFHSLPPNSERQSMNWTTRTNAIIARYTDIVGDEYITYMIDDILTIVNLRQGRFTPFEQEIVNSWSMPPNTFAPRPIN